MDGTVSVMTEDEINSMGMTSIVGAQFGEMDNPVVTSLGGSGINMQDRDGRQIISFKQFEELNLTGARMENYSIRMTWPGTNKINTVQASKYLKWYGIGYRPWIDELKRQKREALADPDGSAKNLEAEGTVAYYCNTKYEGCSRFFDNVRALKFHWKRDHGEEPAFTKDKT